MKRNFKLLALAAMMMVSGMSIVSCNDDVDYIEKQNNDTPKTNEKVGLKVLNGVFESKSLDKDAALCVFFDGGQASISRSNNADCDRMNATVMMKSENSGVLMLNDNTFDIIDIPFGIANDVMYLDMSESADFNHCGHVYLEKKITTRSANAGMDKAAKENAADMATQLLDGFAKTNAQHFLDNYDSMISDPMFGAIFSFDSSNPNVAQFNNIQNCLENITVHAAPVVNTNNHTEVSQAFKEHLNKTMTISNHNKLYNELIMLHPEKKDSLLSAWANATINNSVFTASFPTLVKSYMSSYDANRTCYNVYDEYIMHLYPLAHQAYADRDMLRANDLSVITVSASMMSEYYKTKGLSTSTLQDMLGSYLDFMKYEGSYMKDNGVRICQLDGAYFEMDKNLCDKKIGIYDYYKSYVEEGTKMDNDVDFYKTNGRWVYSYIFSNQHIDNRQEELKDCTFSKAEIDALKKYYVDGGKCTSMAKAFNDELGLRCNDYDLILIGEKAYADFNAWGHYEAHINCSVYDMSTDKYYSDYTVEDVLFINNKKTLRPFAGWVRSFDKSTNAKTVTYAKITHHFKDYDQLVSYYRTQDLNYAKDRRNAGR